MKESPRRYTNPFLSDEENDQVNLTTNQNGKFEKSLEPSMESFQKAKEVYIDKNITECELPEMITCYEESGFNVVKDICVDDGLSNGEIVKCDKEHYELSCNPITINGDKHDDMIKDDLDAQLISTPLDQDSYKNASLFSVTEDDNKKEFVESNIINSNENFSPDNSMQNGEEKIDSSSNPPNNSNILEPSKNSIENVDHQLFEAQSPGSEANKLRQNNHTINIPNEIKMEENDGTLDSDNVKPATASGPPELPLSTESAPGNHDVASNNITLVARGGGESSFSMAGPVSGHITYLGPIAASGSLSHRSDGSNSSVRSFAFPILQNEWNSSPIRMAKVDPRQSRKHRGWRRTLMCCRF